MIKLFFIKSVCPVCHTEDKVYIYDHGLKYWKRLFAGNNRFACRNCKVCWRRKKPLSYVAFASRSRKTVSAATSTHTKRRQQWSFTGFNVKKNFWVYCVIGILSVVFAYVMIYVVPSDVQKTMSKPRIEATNAGNQGSPAAGIRNDKLAGKKELQRLGNGKKNW
jgi:hypothetical protein